MIDPRPAILAESVQQGKASPEPRPHIGAVVSSSDVEARPWEPLPEGEGIRMRVLWRDPISGSYTAMLEVAPGARLRPHLHRNAEHHLFVVRGSCELAVSDRVLGPGSYVYVPVEEMHGIEGAGAEGCTLLLLDLEART